LEQIERDALNDEVPLATALRKCVALGGLAGSEQLRDWASRELRGYFDDEEGAELPTYRIVSAPLLVDGIVGNYKVTGQQFPPSTLPDFAREHLSNEVKLRDGVGKLEALAREPQIKLMPPMGTDLAHVMNAENSGRFQHIESLYWSVAPATMLGVLDQIRTALTQLVAELRAAMASTDEIPSPQVADQAVNVIVSGKRPRVNVIAAQSAGTGSSATVAPAEKAEVADQGSGFWTRWRRIGAFIVGCATVVGVVFAGIQLH
jgi:hypothetical protein